MSDPITPMSRRLDLPSLIEEALDLVRRRSVRPVLYSLSGSPKTVFYRCDLCGAGTVGEAHHLPSCLIARLENAKAALSRRCLPVAMTHALTVQASGDDCRTLEQLLAIASADLGEGSFAVRSFSLPTLPRTEP